MNDIEIGRFYVAYVAHQGKLLHVEGVAESHDDMTITLAPTPHPSQPAPVKARVYRQQIVRID